ncbi:MAG: hypothetical protein BWX95_02750 [Bacteroidetes bacterium ADurb.Bin141]|nr:MAG: hypothetical protein BWX95_02750 [Bacteroidetes bacterium ADurb.Bin141]
MNIWQILQVMLVTLMMTSMELKLTFQIGNLQGLQVQLVKHQAQTLMVSLPLVAEEGATCQMQVLSMLTLVMQGTLRMAATVKLWLNNQSSITRLFR